jgi:hypothetical protein
MAVRNGWIRRGSRSATAVSAMCAVMSVSVAQQSPSVPEAGGPQATPPPARRLSGDPAMDRAVSELERGAGARPAIQPVAGESAGNLSQARSAARLVPQGTFLPSRRGRLLGAGAHFVFAFEPDAAGKAEPPMIVLPNEWLSAMERQVQERGPETVFVVSGSVYAYRQHNYFLVTATPIVSVMPPPPRPESTGAAPTAPSVPAAIADPAVEKILAELREAGGDRRSAQPLMPPARKEGVPSSVGPAGSGPALLPEGTFLASRRGRLAKSASGEWMFVVDSGAEGVAEPAMVLMPCQNLAGMERTAEQRGDAVTFSVSGQVFAYRERNYLLPAMYVLNRRTDEVMPTQ